MSLTFIHVSDIHFGQKPGSQEIVHGDVQECLIKDAAELVNIYANSCATGVIVTGDIAYSGKENEYKRAGKWLDRLTEAINCKKTDVQVVPGNHDIDRGEISHGCKLMLKDVIDNGETALDKILANKDDRENFYHRFRAYRRFAEGYNCPLDSAGGIFGKRRFNLARGRDLSFIGLNSALICSANDEEEYGNLLLGARQHVLPRKNGQELVVLCHHPLDWLQDSCDARNYVQSRARVFISGHIHRPSANKITIEDGCDLLMLSAGATTPPEIEGNYNYTYNLLKFERCPENDGLMLTIVPRAWSPSRTCFDTDKNFCDSPTESFVLGCPNFRKSKEKYIAESVVETIPRPGSKIARVEDSDSNESIEGDSMTDSFPLLLLRFFRDLSPDQRIAVLVEVDALPDGWEGTLTHNIERRFLEALFKSGQYAEVQDAIDKIQTQTN